MTIHSHNGETNMIENIQIQTTLANLASVAYNNGIILGMLRNGNKLRPATVVLINDIATVGGQPLSEVAIFRSDFHGAPWKRQDYVLGGLTVRVPANLIGSQRLQWLRDNGVYDQNDKCLVNCLVVDYTYDQAGNILGS